jgi:hypothetical protein
MQMIGDGRTGRVLDGWMIGMSGDAMCSLHRARTWSTGFLVEPQTKVDGLSVVWPQNHWDGFLRFGHKTGGNGFLWFSLKTSGGFLS